MTVLLVACSRQVEQEPKPNASAAPTSLPLVQKALPATALSKTEEDKRQHELMRAVFKDAYDPQRGSALSSIAHAKGEVDQPSRFLIEIVSTKELADGRTVVIANAMPSDDKGEAQVGHVTPGVLNVYFLRRTAGQWEVLERRENVGSLGSSGHIGSIDWVELAPEKPGFMVTSVTIGQGYGYGRIEVFDLSEGVRDLGGFASLADNSGACTEDTEECWEISGAVRVVDGDQPSPYRDLVIDFTSKKYTVTEEKNGKQIEHLKSSVKETARYRFDGKQFKLISGVNPVSND